MNQERILQVLLSPHISEKSSLATDVANQHVFKVVPDATKLEVKRAVEALFEVKVARVQIQRVKGKNKRFGQTLGRRGDWKKAIVRLEEGHDISFIGAEA